MQHLCQLGTDAVTSRRLQRTSDRFMIARALSIEAMIRSRLACAGDRACWSIRLVTVLMSSAEWTFGITMPSSLSDES